MKRRKLKRTMKAGSGGRKGAKYERKVCQRLSLWVSDKTRTDVFWRSAMSGGRHTILKRGKDRGGLSDAHAGDIVVTHELGVPFTSTFVVECKHHKDTKMSQLLFGKRGWITRVWEKLLRECAGCREPFAVIRQNLQPEVLITNEAGFRLLSTGGDLPLLATIPWKGMYIVLFRDVLMIRYSRIESLLKLRALNHRQSQPVGTGRLQDSMPRPRLRLRPRLKE